MPYSYVGGSGTFLGPVGLLLSRVGVRCGMGGAGVHVPITVSRNIRGPEICSLMVTLRTDTERFGGTGGTNSTSGGWPERGSGGTCICKLSGVYSGKDGAAAMTGAGRFEGRS